jgi:hypothetical protein
VRASVVVCLGVAANMLIATLGLGGDVQLDDLDRCKPRVDVGST